MVKRWIWVVFIGVALAQEPPQIAYLGPVDSRVSYVEKMAYVPAQDFARGFGLKYLEASGLLSLDLGVRTVRMRIYNDAEAAAKAEPPGVYRAERVLYLPLNYAAEALGLKPRARGGIIEIDLPTAELEFWEVRSEGGRDRIMLRFSREVNARIVNVDTIEVVGARGKSETRVIEGHSLREVSVSNGGYGLRVTLSRGGNASPRILPLPSGIAIDLGPAPVVATSAPLVVIDPGHGGNETGVKTGEFVEKDFTLALAQALVPALEARGFRTALSRDDDSNPTPEERARLAASGRVVLSLHASTSPQANGNARIVTYSALANSEERPIFSRNIATVLNSPETTPDQRRLLARLAAPDQESSKLAARLARANPLKGSTTEAPVYILSTSAASGALIEMAGASDPAVQNNLKDPDYLKELAQAIAAAVAEVVL